MQLINYFKGVIKELKNITFPKAIDVKITSMIIFIIICISMIVVGFADFTISKFIKILLGI